MSLRVTNNFGNNYNYYGNNVPERSPLSVNPRNSQTPKIPQIPNNVTFTALGCDTEQKLARASYMAAAAKAGITDISAQARFADQILAGNSADLTLNGKIELDDAKVRSRLLNRSVIFTLSADEKEALREFRKQYIADGGKIRSNQNPTVDLRETTPSYGVTAPATTSTNSKFRVLLNNNGKPITEQRILAQFAEDQYKGSILWGQNYLQIAEMSVEQGVKPKIINLNRIGNKIAVEFEISPLDRAKIHENYRIVQAEVNRAEETYRNFANNNEISSFLRGVFNGAFRSAKGTIGLLNLPETFKALWSILSSPIETFNALYKELSETWQEFKDAPANKKAEMIGELVGAAVFEILLTKGIGKFGSILAKTKTGMKLLEKADDLPLTNHIPDRFKGYQVESLEPNNSLSKSLPRNGDRPLVNQGNLPTCGSDSCAMIMQTFGTKVDRVKLANLAKVGKNGTTIDKLVSVLKSNGISNARWKTKLTLDDLAEATRNGNPAITAMSLNRGGHAVVVDGITVRQGKKVVAVRDPAGGRQYFVPAEEFEKKFTRQAILTNAQK